LKGGARIDASKRQGWKEKEAEGLKGGVRIKASKRQGWKERKAEDVPFCTLFMGM